MHAVDRDITLAQRVLSGEINAYEELVRANREAVSRQVARRVPKDQAREIVCEVFSRAYLSLGKYRGESPFSHWLAIIAARTCHDFWRKAYREKETPLSGLSESGKLFVEQLACGEESGSPETMYGKKEAAELLEYALGGLSATDRMVVALTHLEEKSVAETAELLGLSRANVKVRAFRARRKLRLVLAAALGEDRT